MKSIIQEASSLSKAIEQGWQKAGKPTMFSVKILQDANKNFIGMTTQNAKIAFYFGRFDELQTQQQAGIQTQQVQQHKQPQQGQQRTGFSQQSSKPGQQQPQQRSHRRFYRRPQRHANTNRPQQDVSSQQKTGQQQESSVPQQQSQKDKPQ